MYSILSRFVIDREFGDLRRVSVFTFSVRVQIKGLFEPNYSRVGS